MLNVFKGHLEAASIRPVFAVKVLRLRLRSLLLGLLSKEFTAQAFILIIAHHEHFLYPLDRIPVQLLVLLLAIFAPSTHACRGLYRRIDLLAVGALYMISLAGRVDDF